jgi:PTS system mannose-specific IIA component
MARPDSNRPIVGVVVVTHEGAATCLCGAAEAILGKVANLEAVSCGMDETREQLAARISAACDRADSGVGVLILVDVHGSTPFRAAMTMLDGVRPAEVLCGVNLPMLIKMSTVDRSGLTPSEIAEILRDIGRRSIRLGSELTGRVFTGGPR